MIFNARLPGADLTYRVYAAPRIGVPDYPPAAVARKRHGITTVYASWNGDTQVSAWRVLQAPSSGSRPRPLATVPKRGFETAITLRGSFGVLYVQALDARGHRLASARVL